MIAVQGTEIHVERGVIETLRKKKKGIHEKTEVYLMLANGQSDMSEFRGHKQVYLEGFKPGDFVEIEYTKEGRFTKNQNYFNNQVGQSIKKIQ